MKIIRNILAILIFAFAAIMAITSFNFIVQGDYYTGAISFVVDAAFWGVGYLVWPRKGKKHTANHSKTAVVTEAPAKSDQLPASPSSKKAAHCHCCGRARNPLERFTKHGLCQSCNDTGRDVISQALDTIHHAYDMYSTCDIVATYNDNPAIKEQLQSVVGIIDNLETQRPKYPFFTSSLQNEKTLFVELLHKIGSDACVSTSANEIAEPSAATPVSPTTPSHTTPTVAQQPTAKQKTLGVGVILAIIMVIIFFVQSSCKTDTSSQLRIDDASFKATVATQITAINTNGIIGKVEATADGRIAIVNLYLSNNLFWDVASETDQKDFVKNVGDLMESVAIQCVVNSDATKQETVGVATYIYSAAGVELAERSVLGKIKIK